MNLHQFHKGQVSGKNWKLWEMRNIIAENYGLGTLLRKIMLIRYWF